MLRKVFAGAVLVALLATFAFAGNVPPEVAAKLKSVVQQVKQYYQQHGFNAVVKEVSPNGKFGVGTLGGNYAWILRDDGIMVAHGANSALNGKNFFILRDSSGRQFVKEFVEKAKAGGGFTFYKWSNPKTHRIQRKVAYCEMLDVHHVVCAGAYLK